MRGNDASERITVLRDRNRRHARGSIRKIIKMDTVVGIDAHHTISPRISITLIISDGGWGIAGKTGNDLSCDELACIGRGSKRSSHISRPIRNRTDLFDLSNNSSASPPLVLFTVTVTAGLVATLPEESVAWAMISLGNHSKGLWYSMNNSNW